MREKIEDVSWFGIVTYMLILAGALVAPTISIYKKTGSFELSISIAVFVLVLFTALHLINLRVYRIIKHLNEKIDEENKNEK